MIDVSLDIYLMKGSGVDQRMQQLLQKCQLGSPKATCSSGNKVTYLCINPSCTKPSLHCEDCENCDFHISKNNCQSVRLKVLTSLVNNIFQNKKMFVKVILQEESKMIEKIRQASQKLLQRIGLSCLQEKYRLIMQQIYKGNKEGNKEVKLAGKQAAFIFENLQMDKKVAEKQSSKEIAAFRQELKRVTQYVFSLQNKLLNPTQISQPKSIIPPLPNTIINRYINSVIIGQNIKDCQFVYECLEDNDKSRKVKDLYLVYKASNHNFEAFNFGNVSSNTNILVIAKTEFGKVIGGYFPQCGPSAFGNKFSGCDRSGESFLFSVTLKQKMKPLKNSKFQFIQKKQKEQIVQRVQKGFGFKGVESLLYYDLYICDRCNVENKSYAYFPINYNHNQKYMSNQKTYTLFSGATKGANFKVLEYEIFKVTFT